MPHAELSPSSTALVAGAPPRPALRGLPFVSPYLRGILVILGLTVLLAITNVVEPLVLKHVFDALSGDDPARGIATGVLALLGLALAREILQAASTWLTWRARLGIHYDLLTAVVDRLHTLPVAFHREHGVGALMTKLERGIQGLVGALTEVAFNIVPSVLYLGFSIFVMIRLDWRMTLVVLLFVPAPAIIAALAAGEQDRRERNLFDRWVRIYARFNEVLHGIVTVRSFAMEDREKKRFLTSVHEANRVVVKGVARDSSIGAVRGLIVTLARVAAVGFGAWLVMRGQISVGTVVAFLGYVGGMFAPVQGLTGSYQTLVRARVSHDTVFSILDHEDYLGDAPDAKDVAHVQGDVRFDGVHFQYDGARDPILRGIDLHVKQGETVAIVGPSGAGKSTLMALLQRIYDPTEGAVYVDGEDIRGLKQRSLRRQIGVVLQDALLFDDTVQNNIAYGKPDASFDEVLAAAQAANADAFVRRLPQGYATSVGERGGRLSVGERQRIAIARALLKDPPLLILDEATSALDAESEALVQEALSRLIRGRTTFIIAHRLSTVVSADRIIVLKDGRIAEQGRHQDLMARGGEYASLVRHQTRGLLADGAPLASVA